MLILFAVCSAGIFLGSYLYLDTLRKHATEDLADRVRIALEVETRNQEVKLEDIIYWNDAYKNAIVRPDQKWIDYNVGKYLLEKLGFEFTLGAREGQDLTYISAIPEFPGYDFMSLRKAGLDKLFDRSRSNKNFFKVESGFITLDDGIYLVSVGPFIDKDEERIRPDYSFIVFGQKIDRKFISNIADRFKLPGLKLTNVKEDGLCVALPEVDGRVAGWLLWSHPCLGYEVLPGLIYVAGGFFLMAAVLTGLILSRESRNRKCYEDELRRTTDFAQSQSREKSAFMAAMTHDLNSPVHGAIDALEQLRMETLTESQLDMVNAALGSSRRMKNMLVDFFDISRSDFAELRVVDDQFNLRESLNAVYEMFEVAAAKKGLRFYCSVDAVIPELLVGDEHKLVRVLLNLVDNAFKYTPSGGSVEVEVCPVQGEGRKVRVLFLVKDSGKGISDEAMVHVFEDSGHGGMAEGDVQRGLGLTIVRWFVLCMDGTICMQSEEGRGTEFAVCLPFELPEK